MSMKTTHSLLFNQMIPTSKRNTVNAASSEEAGEKAKVPLGKLLRKSPQKERLTKQKDMVQKTTQTPVMGKRPMPTLQKEGKRAKHQKVGNGKENIPQAKRGIKEKPMKRGPPLKEKVEIRAKLT